MFGLSRQFENLREEILNVTSDVYSSGTLMNGEWTYTFEKSIAERTNREYAIAVNSCSQALLFSFMYLVKSQRLKHPIIAIPEISFVATSSAPSLVGLSLSYCDVDYQGLIDLDKLNLSENPVGGIMYVNLCGNMVDYSKLKLVTAFFSDNQPIIEDAAQSFGASINGIPSGKLGTISTLSFDPTKNLPSYGSGGIVLTDDADINAYMRDIRDNGKEGGFIQAGTNSRMSESDCAQMMIKLKYFDEWQIRRKRIAEYYTAALQDYVNVPRANVGVEHAWSKYIIRVNNSDERMRLMNKLLLEGIDCKINYHKPLSSFDTTLVRGSDRAISFCKYHLSLPIYPELTDSEVDVIVDTVKKSFV